TMSGRLNIESLLLATAFAVFALLLIMEKWRPYKKLATMGLKRSFSTNASAFMVNNLIMSLLSISSLLVVAENHSHHGLLSSLNDAPLKWALSFVLFDFGVYA